MTNMDSGIFSVKDINEELLHSIDRFFKATIRNALTDYCQKKYTEEKKKSRTLPFEECENLLFENDEYADVDFLSLRLNGYCLHIRNLALAKGLQELMHSQRTVLLHYVLSGMSIREIAEELQIGERTARLHKQNAIKKLKRRLEENESDR